MPLRLLCLALAMVMAACAPPPAWQGTAYAPRGAALPQAGALRELGRALFFDPVLSASGQTSCASCHDPRHAYGPPNDLPVAWAGRDGRQPGLRAVPSLRYLQRLPPFSEHHYENDGDDSLDGGPTGGHTWDGRASSARDQARLPLLSANEMANASPSEVVQRLRCSPQAEALRAVFGAAVFDDDGAAFDALLLSLEVFQQTPAEFAPYSSRYDQVLRGAAMLTPQEARGLALFDDPAKGNCASCHPSRLAADGAFPLFTDFGLVALGVPRRPDATVDDLGLCGPLRRDFVDRPEYCGRFRAPSLRNVAVRRRYFHNGVFDRLDEAIRFYARRDSEPGRYYPRGPDGQLRRYDDLPEAYHGNVETGPPFGAAPGDPPSLSDDEVADIAAFLRTLTDADQLR